MRIPQTLAMTLLSLSLLTSTAIAAEVTAPGQVKLCRIQADIVVADKELVEYSNQVVTAIARILVATPVGYESTYRYYSDKFTNAQKEHETYERKLASDEEEFGKMQCAKLSQNTGPKPDSDGGASPEANESSPTTGAAAK